MKDVVLNELKKELSKKEIKNVFINICKYFNENVKLIKDYNDKN